MEAQDAERRKIERNLHDGAQQQLIALTIHLALLEESADDPAAVRELAPAVKDGVRAALDDLRDLARGIYPPVLADHGLIPALQAQARKVALPVEIDADGIGRYPQDTEAAVYFCTLEALQNITKYASASRATVGLSCSDGSLQFTVTDDGTGFDTATTRPGTGLQGMADRLAALGGALHVRSRPGRERPSAASSRFPHLAEPWPVRVGHSPVPVAPVPCWDGTHLLEEDLAMSDHMPEPGNAGSEPDLSHTAEFAKLRAVMRASEKHREGGVDPELEDADADPGAE